METIAIICGLGGAGIAQLLNRYKANDTTLVKLSLVAWGFICYALASGLPQSFYGPQFLAWLTPAWLWVTSVPGTASLIGLHPAMKTDIK